MMFMKGMLAFAGAIIIVWFVFLIYSILAYIFGALGLSSMAKNAGLKNPWFAWIPGCNLFLLGELAGPINISSINITAPGLTLILASVSTMILSAIPRVGFLFYFLYLALFAIYLNHIYKRFIPEKSTQYTVLSIIVAVAFPWILYSLRHTQPVDVGDSGWGSGYSNGGHYHYEDPNGADYDYLNDNIPDD